MNKTWGIIALVVAALYWLQAVLIPLALAVLLTFLLSPVVGTLERRGLGRVPSVFVDRPPLPLDPRRDWLDALLANSWRSQTSCPGTA